jgi:hypothetical protein
MRVSFEQKGGITGATLRSSVEINDLPVDDAKILDDAIENSNFFNLDKESLPKKGADYFIYTITVDSGDRSYKIIASDSTAPKALKPLIRYMKKRALL